MISFSRKYNLEIDEDELPYAEEYDEEEGAYYESSFESNTMDTESKAGKSCNFAPNTILEYNDNEIIRILRINRFVPDIDDEEEDLNFMSSYSIKDEMP